MHEHLFISDLHLSSERPATIELFQRFLRERAVQADSLFILGDLFDAWVGDDNKTPPIPGILGAMKGLTHTGTDLFFMHGNRDFLVGEVFAKETGCQLLQDPHVLQLAESQVLLMHGDLLCSDDLDYQEWRTRFRTPAVIGELLAKTIEERIAIAVEYRRRSGESTSLQAADIMDINQRTVEQYLRTAEARLLIHGHTHRPASHRFELDGAVASRLVLPEWRETVGGYLSVRSDAISRHVFI